MASTTSWSDDVEQVLAGDLVVVLAHVTGAGGVVLTPLTNFGLHDRNAGTVTILTSLGAWKKLQRMEADPHVALVFQTRAHGYATGDGDVVMQGDASFEWTPDRRWLESIEPRGERFMGPRPRAAAWGRWTRIYHWERVAVTVQVLRVWSWPDDACRAPAQVAGEPAPTLQPDSQAAPGKGTGPRVDLGSALRRLSRQSYVLAGGGRCRRLPAGGPGRRRGDRPRSCRPASSGRAAPHRRTAPRSHRPLLHGPGAQPGSAHHGVAHRG